MTRRAMMFGTDRGATSACWILSHVESRTKQNQQQPKLRGRGVRCNQCCGVPGSVGTITIRDSMWNRRGFYELANGGPGISLEVDNAYRQGGIVPLFVVQNFNGHVDGTIGITYAYHDTESQAAYAWFCNLGCTCGGGPPFFLGFTNSVSVDGNTRPLQITGGGNSPINPLNSPTSSLRSR
jgi:hypothetical protein